MRNHFLRKATLLLVTSHNLLVNSALDFSLFWRCSNLVVLQSSWSVQDLLQSINGIFLLHKLSAAFLSFSGCFCRCGFPVRTAISSQSFRTNYYFSIRMELKWSYFELYDALVVLWGELGVLEKWVLHIDQVPLLRHVAVQDKRHLGDHRWLQSQFGQRGRRALDGGPVLSVHTALNATQAGEQRSGNGCRHRWSTAPATDVMASSIKSWKANPHLEF